MGTWGPGNFHNDDAGEYLDLIQQRLIRVIEKGLKGEPSYEIHYWGEKRLMPTVDILLRLCQHYDVCPFVSEHDIKRWKEIYLANYDAYSDVDGPKPDHKVERRKVIEDTFNMLEEMARECGAM